MGARHVVSADHARGVGERRSTDRSLVTIHARLAVESIRIPHSHSMIPRLLLMVLLVLNFIVLVGQIWPAGAPPFARAVNIAFLVASLAVLAFMLRGKPSAR